MKGCASKWQPVAVQAVYVQIYGTCAWVEIYNMRLLHIQSFGGTRNDVVSVNREFCR